MAASIIDGPFFRYGGMGAMASATFGSYVGDPNPSAGPDGVYQGTGLLDPRYWFAKDQVGGSIGRAASHLMLPVLRSVNQIPAATAANNIAAAANAANGVAMTLAAASVGFTPNIPTVLFNAGGLTTGSIQTGAVLDFGFAFGTVTSGSTTIVVANSYQFQVGMPLVITGVGNAGGTTPLLTNVASITDTTHIVVNDTPLASLNPAAIGTGNFWGPNSSWSTPANMRPTAHMPWLGAGPSAIFDTRQSIARGVRITGVSGGAGGAFTVRGADVYGQPMSEVITATSGATTTYGLKAFKVIFSVTPGFADAHNYTVGTSDVFGIHYYSGSWEDLRVAWNALMMTSSTGWTAGLSLITTPTGATADVRGTIQTGALGGGSGIGSTASNGTVSSLAMSGVRLLIDEIPSASQFVMSTPASNLMLFGATQFTS